MQMTVRFAPQPLEFQNELRLEGLLRLHLSAIARWVRSVEAVLNDSIDDSRATRFRCRLVVYFRDRAPVRVAGAAATQAGALGMAAGAALRATLGRAADTEDDAPPLGA